MSVFGVRIEGGGIDHVTSLIEKGESEGPLWLVTVNPEILLEARKNPLYKGAVRAADERVVDGFGLFLFLKYVLRRKISRLTGVELSDHLVRLAAQNGWRVGLIGASVPHKGTAERAAERISERFPELQIHAEDGGLVRKNGSDDAQGEEARHRLTLFNPDVLLVALGHPKQELWIQRYKADFPELKVIIGVGGTLDFWADNVRRAPVWVRRIGLEWLWRLIQEPRRIGRIFRAVILFPLFAFVDYFRGA